MEQANVQTKNSSAAVIAAIISVIFIAVVTVVADLVPILKAQLASTFSHHWIGKGILSICIFLASYLLLAIAGNNPTKDSLAARVRLLSWLATLGTLVIFAFFLYETYLK